jgi:ABC-2 type transport system permease protein
LRSPDTAVVRRAPIQPLLAKELREIASGRALWTMLLILCPLVGYSFFQAVSLYGEASAAAVDAPVLGSGLSPLDGVLVPTFGGLYLAATLLFPFVAIRTLGREKESGALALLVQLPYRLPALIAAKLAAVFVGWIAAVICAASALPVWLALGGHLHIPETFDLVIGHALYGVLVGAIALFSASISESAEERIVHDPDPILDGIEPFRESRGHEAGASGVDPFDRLHQGSPQLFERIPLRCTRPDGVFDPFDQRVGVGGR